LYRATDVDLPLLGKCSGGEGLILTLTFFGLCCLRCIGLFILTNLLCRVRPFLRIFQGSSGTNQYLSLSPDFEFSFLCFSCSGLQQGTFSSQSAASLTC